MALALVNALNHQNALQLPEDENNEIMFEKFKITKGTKVAMVGYFGPLIKRFEQREAVLDILDQSRGLGRMVDFYKKLQNWADVLFLTSTSILNNSTEEILAHNVHAKGQKRLNARTQYPYGRKGFRTPAGSNACRYGPD